MIGANIYNVLAIMGIVAIVSPLTVPEQIVRFDIWFMLAVTLGLLISVILVKGVTRAVGGIFLGAYGLYIVLQYYGLKLIGL